MAQTQKVLCPTRFRKAGFPAQCGNVFLAVGRPCDTPGAQTSVCDFIWFGVPGAGAAERGGGARTFPSGGGVAGEVGDNRVSNSPPRAPPRDRVREGR